VATILTGCAATNATPGPPHAWAPSPISPPPSKPARRAPPRARRSHRHRRREILDKKPLATFPASVAVVRVQGPGYAPQTTGWGRGAYSVITERDVESEQDVEKLDKLPQVRGVAPINLLLLPEMLQNDFELRQAARSCTPTSCSSTRSTRPSAI